MRGSSTWQLRWQHRWRRDFYYRRRRFSSSSGSWWREKQRSLPSIRSRAVPPASRPRSKRPRRLGNGPWRRIFWTNHRRRTESPEWSKKDHSHELRRQYIDEVSTFRFHSRRSSGLHNSKQRRHNLVWSACKKLRSYTLDFWNETKRSSRSLRWFHALSQSRDIYPRLISFESSTITESRSRSISWFRSMFPSDKESATTPYWAEGCKRMCSRRAAAWAVPPAAHYINDTLRKYLDIFCTAYIDDILIYSNNLREHKEHVKKVLRKLRQADLQIDIEKCEFHVIETMYLDLIVFKNELRMNSRKMKTMKNWMTSANIKNVQAFLEFANYYRRFVRNFSEIASSMTKLTRKDTSFIWIKDCEEVFQILKDVFISDKVLLHFDSNKESVVKADFFDHVSVEVLSQYDNNNILRSVTYFSRKHSSQECNYEIYDKELLAIIRCFEEWRSKLEGVVFLIKIISDHRNLKYFMITKQLSRRQTRWVEYLSRFNFKINYRLDKQEDKSNALTRRSEDLSKEEDLRLEQQYQVILKSHNLELLVNTMISKEESDEEKFIDDLMNKDYDHDFFLNRILELLRKEVRHSKEISLVDCEKINDRLYYRQKMYVSDYHVLKMRLCKKVHDSSSTEHSKRTKTFDILQRNYYWSKYHQFVAQYVRNCHTCSRSKPTHHDKYEVLNSLPVPSQRWKDLSMNIVIDISESISDDKSYNVIMMVIDRLSKMKHLISCRDITNAKYLARLYLNNVWKLHELSSSIVSDRDSQFISKFWRALCRLLRINCLLFTEYHSKIDDQTERFNFIMKQYLRSYVIYLQDDWVNWLIMTEFFSNNHTFETTDISSFLANYGYHSRMNFESHSQIITVDTLFANDFADKMKNINTHMQESMRLAQIKHEFYVNNYRTSASKFHVGDEVWLDARHIKICRTRPKLFSAHRPLDIRVFHPL